MSNNFKNASRYESNTSALCYSLEDKLKRNGFLGQLS